MGDFDDLIPAKKPRNPGKREQATEFDDLIPVAGAPKDNLAALDRNLAAAGLGDIAPPKQFGAPAPLTVPQRVGPVIDPKASRDRRMARGMAGSVFAEEMPTRTFGELAGDTYDRARIGARGVASGLLEVANAPQHAANLVNTSVNGYAAMLGAQARIPMLPSYDWVRGTQAVIEDESKAIRDKMTPTAIRKAAEFDQAEGAIDSVGYLLANPSEGLGFAAEQSPQFLAAGLPGGVTGKLAGAGVFAGGQAGAQVAAENQMRVKRGQITQAEADALTAQAVTTSGVVNTILPRLIPGGTVLEEALSGGKMAGLTRSRGAAIGTLGEGATGGLEEALDQASQNEATGKPLTQGVGKAFALGSLLEAPMGAVAGAMSSGKPATVAPATLGAIARAQADAAQAKTFAEIIGGTPATPADVANDAAIVEAFRARQEVAPEPTGDLDALLAGALPATQPAAPAPVLDIAALERAGVSLGDVVASLTPAAPVPADPSDAGAGVAATPDIDWQAAAEALGLPLEPADGRDNPLAGGDPGGGPATAADRGAVALGDAAGQAGQGGSPARVGGTAVPGDAAGAPAEGVNPDAPGATLTNGFKRGEEPGKRYRVSSSNMGVSLEKRNDESGSASAFFIGKDGALIDGDTIARNNASNVDRLWTPPSDEARVEAESILDEMGKLQLSDPKRAALKDRLRDVVTGKGSSRDNPLPNEREGDAPVGAWVAGPPIPGATPDQTVRQIMEVPIEQIDATEFDSAGNIAPEKRADAERYTEAMRAGDQFPNGRASELPNGKIKLQDGHRRYAAAKASGAKTMRLAVSPMPAGTQAPAVDATTMQNRDRSRAASVSQMQDIRRNPDPERLGFSRDPNTGAPMVGAGKPIPDTDKGRADTVVMASGRRVPVQYAVVEADELAASHDADGRANPGYDAAPLKALNNGRTAGLQAAYASGNTDAYRQGISADAGLHGVSAEAIAGKRNPVLVRLYDPAQNTGDMGAESNATQQLGLSPVEQAQTDARALPDLAGMTWNEDGSISPTGNANFFRAWFANMGDTQAASLQDAQGRPNAAALQRVRGAMVQRAFGDERLLTAMAEEIDPDNRNVMNALVRAAPGFAALDNTEHSRDVKAAMVGGLELLRDAKARGISLRDAIAQGDLLGRNADADAVAAFMADNARSAKRMAEAFKVVAEYAARAETQAATLDVFGAAPQPTVAGALGEAGITENRYGTETGRDDLAVAEGTGSRQPAEVAGAPAGDAFGLQAPAAPAAAQEVAPAPSAGLFGAPSARDYIDAAGRARDARRNGDPGADSRMLAGDGELFAGARPEQASVPARLPGTDAVAQRQVNAENRFLDFAMETGGLTREQATAAMAEYRKAKAIKFDVVGGGFTFTNGGFAERDVLRRAAGLESPKQARRPRNPDTDEVIGVGMLHPTKSSRGRWMFHVYLRDSEGREYDHQVHAHTKAGGYDLQGGYSERIGQQPGTDEPLASVEPAERDANFNRWSKGAPIIEPDEMWTGYEGGPAVFRLFHGTTADFDAFDRSRANPGSDFGAGFYFSNTPDDVGNNYAGIGPDLTQKIEREAERIAQETDRDYSDPEVVAEARKKWVQHDGATMPVFVRVLNPAIVGGPNETRLTFEEPYDEEADEYGEPGGTLVDFIEALRYEADNFSNGDIEAGIAALFDAGLDGEIALSDVIAKLKETEEFNYFADDNGDMASSELIRAALERAGFDGIVDYTVDQKFGSQKRIGKAMAGMSEDTVHVIAFEPTQIKSSTGNSGEFNPSNHSVLAQTETLTDADLTPAEFASMQRQSIDRKALREKLSREQGEADADANGLREAVNKVVRKAGKVVYLRGMDGLPDEVRGPLDRAAAQRGAKMRTAGLFDPSTGTTYLFTDVLKSPQLAAFTAAHEIAGHQGLRALLGADLNTVLDLAEQNPTVRKVAASMTKQRNLRPDQRYLAIEEALADLAAANATGNWTRIEEKHGVKAPLEMRNKFAAMLANVVRKLKALFKARSVGFSDAQVRQLLENARKAAEGKGASYTVANADGTLEQVVFHGTPHTVDRFSLQKIGTGEGAQAYGYGMYFASMREVADGYRIALTADQNRRQFAVAAAMASSKWFKSGMVVNGKKYYDRMELQGDIDRRDLTSFDMPADVAKVFTDKLAEPSGNLYRVDVPEDSDLLDWDKPLSEQPEKVRAALAAADFNGDQVVAAWKTNGAWEHVTAKQLYLRVADDPNPNALSQAGARSGGHKAASEYFNSIGIPGLRYLDGTSRTKGEGSANYVIWDESAIGQPQSALESAEANTLAGMKPSPAAIARMKRMGEDAYIREITGGRAQQKHAESFAFRPVPLPADAVNVADADGFAVYEQAGEDGLPSTFYAVDAGKVVGTIAGGEQDSEMVVDPASRRRGIGAALQRAYRARDPFAASGGMTAAGEKMARRLYREWTQASALESVEEVRDEAAATLEVDRGTAGWGYDNGAWIGRKAALAKARAALQDKMIAWRGAQGQIAEQGGFVTDAMNVYRLENLMHGRVQRGIENIEREQIEPLLAEMRAAGVKAETLEEYLYARHAQERNERIATINPRMPDGGSGMTTADAARILAEADTATLAPLARRVDRIIRDTRRRMLEHGLITQEQFDALDAMYKHYVPLRGRMLEDGAFDADLRSGGNVGGRGVDSRGKVVREALGRNSRAANLLGEIIGDTQRSVILAEKARVGRAAMRLALANPNPDLWTVEPVQTERALNSAGEVYEKIVNDWSDPSIIAVRHKGKLYKLQVTSPELARALNLVGVEQMNAVFRLGGKINRYFSAVLTKYNPAFIAANASRDAIFGLTGMAAEHGEAAALQAALKYPAAVRAAWRLARGTSGTTQADAYAQEFADAGGRTGYVAMPSVEDIAAKVNNVTYGGKMQRTKEAFEAVGDFVGAANDAVENALRLAAFITLRESGMAVDPAAEYAKNLTVNFNRKGEYGSHLNAALLFFNASMQGAHRAGKVLRSPKAMAYVGALAGAQVIAAMAAMGIEDDDGEPLWNKVPDHVKRRNLVMVTPDGGIITVPMPYGFNAIVYGAGRAVTGIANMKRGDTSLSGTAGDWTADVLSATLQAFVPIPVTEGASSLAPVPLQIASSIENNRDGLGFQIRRENPFATGDIPRASLGKPDTIEVFKLAATGLNRLGGGDEFTPPKIDLFDRAPEDLEYLLSEMTGGAGKFVVDVATLGGKLADPDAKIAPRDVPLTNRFASNIDEFASQRAMYYDRKAVVERNLRRVRTAYGDGEAESVQGAQALLQTLPGLQGARFKRRKRDSDNGPAGGVVVQSGSPQFEAEDGSLFAAFKDAGKAADARSERVTEAFDGAPRWPWPTKGSQARNAAIRESDAEMAAELRKFNEAWTRAVVGEMD